MNEDIEGYLTVLSKLLNGQIRGVINQKAREDNLELIQMTLITTWENGLNYGQTLKEQEMNLELLKKELKDGTGESNS